MDLVSTQASQITPSLTLSITSEAKRLREEGIDIADLGGGEPDRDTPEHIKEAAIKALIDGKTKYTDSSGMLPLREAISKKLEEENALRYNPKQISVNCGAKHSCYNAIMATCGIGDEVIIPSPYWVSYPEMVRLAGATPVFVETKQENDWKLTPEEFEDAMSPRTKVIILNSPSNPTGSVYTREELEALGEIALSEDIVIISDEIYEKLVYGEAQHTSIASISEELYNITVTINGFSKGYAMTGWRLGYTAAPYAIANAISNIQSHTTSNPTSFAQYGGLAALQGDQSMIEDMREEYDVRRQYMLGRLNQISNISTIEPQGAFYFLVNTEKTQINSVNLAEKLLSRYHVAAVPGIAFGNDNTLRLSYSSGLDVINEGLNRFEDFCRSH
jgi:aspartate aminotransferase